MSWSPATRVATSIRLYLARAIVKKDHRLSRQEIRFLRKYLGLTAQKFAQILGTENSDQMDRLIRSVAMHIGEGLRKDAEQIVRDFPSIEDEVGRDQYQADVETSTVVYAS